MRTILYGTAALALLAAPAAAQNSQSKSVDPHQLAVQLRKPPLKIDDQQRTTIQNALVAEHTQQNTPKDFNPKVGTALSKSLKIDAMPEALGRQLPVMKEYGYAKTAADILVIDPMDKKIVAIIPRKFPADASVKPLTPVEWAQSHAQELTGQAPQSGSNADQAPETPSDAAAVGNGNASNAQPQDSGLQPGYQGNSGRAAPQRNH